jgi:hypothetical protein
MDCHLQIRDHVFDLGALVESRPAITWYPMPCRTARPQHAGLRIHPVENRDLAARETFLDERGDARGTKRASGMLVLDLDRLNRFSRQVGRSASAFVRCSRSPRSPRGGSSSSKQ